MQSFGRIFERKARKRLLERAAEEAEYGRRLAMYDRQTGLLASWYIRLRFEEETKRATRRDRPVSIILLRAPKVPDFGSVDMLVSWLSEKIRPYDLATHLGDGEFLVVLPDTDAIDSEGVIKRLGTAVEGITAGVSTYPDDALTLDELTQTARTRLHP
jgi:PleD family two-component response regulator